MRCSILLVSCLSLLEAYSPAVQYGLGISLNGKLSASTLQAQTVLQSVKDDNGLLDKALELSRNPQTAVGVKRFVELASEHATSVATVCSGLKSVLKEADSAPDWSSIVASVKQACDSRDELSIALDYWRENSDFIIKNIPSGVQYLDTSCRIAIESCVSELSTLSACRKAS